jgi:hypothetical protein
MGHTAFLEMVLKRNISDPARNQGVSHVRGEDRSMESGKFTFLTCVYYLTNLGLLKSACKKIKNWTITTVITIIIIIFY